MCGFSYACAALSFPEVWDKGAFSWRDFLFLFDRYAFIGYTGYNVFERR